MAGKQPYIPLYVNDYLADTRDLPLYVRGAWADLICFMWNAKPRGELTKTIDGFAGLLSCEREEAERCLDLLKQNGTADFVLLPFAKIKIISRRMKRDMKISEIRAQAGKKGGEKKFANDLLKQNAIAKTQAKHITSIDIDIENKNEVKRSAETFLTFEEVHAALFGDERFIEEMAMVHQGKDLEQAFRECFMHHSQSPNPPATLWFWRQKFNTWLSISKPSPDGKLTTKDKFVRGHAEDFAKRRSAK